MVNRLARSILSVLPCVLAACGSQISTDRTAPPAATAPVVATDGQGAAAEAASGGHASSVLAAGESARSGNGSGVGRDGLQATTLPLTTVLYSERDAELTSRRAGVVATIDVEMGDAVQEGQQLARLDDGRELAALAAATAARELANAEHDRAAQLAKQGMITAGELDSATWRLRSAEASLADATVRLDYTRVRAPFASTITRRFIHIGQTVAEGEPLFRATALHPLRALVRVPELAAAALRPGRAVRLRGLDGREARGRILRISPAVDPGSGTVEVLVDVPDPGGLKPGSSVNVEFLVSSERS